MAFSYTKNVYFKVPLKLNVSDNGFYHIKYMYQEQPMLLIQNYKIKFSSVLLDYA